MEQKTKIPFKKIEILISIYTRLCGNTLHDKTMEKDMEKWRYEQAVIECKRWRILIKRFLGETLLSFQKKS